MVESALTEVFFRVVLDLASAVRVAAERGLHCKQHALVQERGNTGEMLRFNSRVTLGGMALSRGTVPSVTGMLTSTDFASDV